MASRHLITTYVLVETFNRTAREHKCNPLFVILTSDEDNGSLLRQVARYFKFSRGVWLLFKSTDTPLQTYFNKVHVPYDSHFLVAHRARKNEVVSLTEVYRVDLVKPLQVFQVGRWSLSDGFNWTNFSVYERRGQVHGAVIKVGFSTQEPLVIQSKSHPEEPFGLLMDMWNVLNVKMNFSSRFYMPADHETGILESNGSWSGVVGMLVNEQADVGINLFTFTHTRESVIDYFPPLWSMKVSVIIKRPEMEVSSITHILAPFSFKLWITILGIMAVLMSFMWITWHISRKQVTNSTGVDSIKYEHTLYIFGTFCQQSHYVAPNYWLCRLIYAISQYIGLLLFMIYSATFISFLSVRRSKFPFVDFQGILDDNTYRLGVVLGSAHEHYLKNSSIPLLKKVYTKLIAPYDLPRGYVEGVRRICSEKNYGFVMPYMIYRGLLRDAPCRIAEVPKAYYTISMSMIVQENNPYKSFFRHYVQDMRRSGILVRCVAKSLPLVMKEVIHDPPHSVSYDTVHIFLCILLIGIGISCFLCFVEVSFYRFKQKKQSQRKKDTVRPVKKFRNV